MSKEVILFSEIKGLGIEGDVVKVTDGYARNYLFPKKLAAVVNEATRRQVEKIRKERAEERVKSLEQAQALARTIAQSSCTIPVKTGEEGKLFGSVTVSLILDALKEQGFKLDKHQVALEQPIRELGVYDVPLQLHAEVKATIKVWVVEE